MGAWTYTEHRDVGGRFKIVLSRPGHGQAEVSMLRGAPTHIDSISDADPFGDATARLSFPQISAFDDLSAPELGAWLGYYSNIEIYWVPAVPANRTLYPREPLVFNPLSGQPDLMTPDYLYRIDGAGKLVRRAENRKTVFEGFVADMGFSADDSGSALTMDCQGALFQVDRYLAKPFFPLQPWPIELLIAELFRHDSRPHLRTRALEIRFPLGWRKRVPHYSKGTSDLYIPVGKAGSLWTGYTSRDTGGWDHALTGYIQNQLSVLITDKGSGVTRGNNWTIHHYRKGELVPKGLNRAGQIVDAHYSPGRLPVLEIRDRRRRADVSVWLGQPGVRVDVNGDSTQSANLVYGEGTSVDGTGWRNAVVGTDRTSYLPLAYAPEVWPVAKDNPSFDPREFTSEAYVQYGPGFDLPAAVTVAQQQLERDRNPGWTGTITLTVDPQEMSRWQIRAGMTLKLRGFLGTGETGMNFHIAATNKAPMEGTVELTVDTRYRDLLTVAEAHERTIDPLTPVRLLQVGKASVTIEDIQAPWDYHAGSGYIPHQAVHFDDHRPQGQQFPYVSWTKAHPPLRHPHWYVKVRAQQGYDAATKTWKGDGRGRWTGPVPIRMAEAGDIARLEVRCVDINGNVVKAPFHVSLYYYSGTAVTNMPLANGVYSPYNDNAFEKTDGTGSPTPSFLWPADGFIQGYGSKVQGVLNRAGFWPGRETDGDKPTGLLVDETQFHFDLTQYHQFFAAKNPPGRKPEASDIEIYAMFYCEWTEPVYFQGRLFKLNQGGGAR